MRIDGLRNLRALELGQAAEEWLRSRMPDCEQTPEQIGLVRSPESDDGSTDELLEALETFRLGPALTRSGARDVRENDRLAGALRVWLTFNGDSASAAPDLRKVGPALAAVIEQSIDGPVQEATAQTLAAEERDLITALHEARGVRNPRRVWADEQLVTALRAWCHAVPQASDRELVRMKAAQMLQRAARSIDEQIRDGNIGVDYPDSGDAYELGRLREGFARFAEQIASQAGPVERIHANDAHLITAASERAVDELQRDLECEDYDETAEALVEARIGAYDDIGESANKLCCPAAFDGVSAAEVEAIVSNTSGPMMHPGGGVA